ncbi:class I SAM-dependent methyltransferase [bacterium]|nr:class I SAM-dependent methyltransferase [bacterium]
MKNTDRVDTKLFEEDHYLGKPAEMKDRIIGRRLGLLRSVENFTGETLNCIEIGCGNGASTVQLYSDFKSVLGLEYFPGHESTFNQLKSELGAKNVEFKEFNIEKGPYPEQADRLVSFEVIEHLESEDSVANYAKSLKDGGLAVISVPNKWWIFEQHGARLPLLPWNRVPFFSWLPRPIHEKWALARIYTKTRIKKLMEKSGFEVLDMKYITAPMDVLPEGKFKDFVISTFFNSETTKIPFFSTSIFVVARKKQA